MSEKASRGFFNRSRRSRDLWKASRSLFRHWDDQIIPTLVHKSKITLWKAFDTFFQQNCSKNVVFFIQIWYFINFMSVKMYEIWSRPGIEPGPLGWKSTMLTLRPRSPISVKKLLVSGLPGWLVFVKISRFLAFFAYFWPKTKTFANNKVKNTMGKSTFRSLENEKYFYP